MSCMHNPFVHRQEEGECQRLSAQFAQQWQARGTLLESSADPTARAAKFLLQAHKELEPGTIRLLYA